MKKYLSSEVVAKYEELGREKDKMMFSVMPDQFHCTGETSEKASFDAWASNITGGTSIVENKTRAGFFNTTMLEADKWARLVAAYTQYGAWSWFANYWAGTDELYVFFIPVVMNFESEFEFKRGMKVKGPDGEKKADRFLIPNEYALVIKDGEITKYPKWYGEKFSFVSPRAVDEKLLEEELKKIRWEQQNQD